MMRRLLKPGAELFEFIFILLLLLEEIGRMCGVSQPV